MAVETESFSLNPLNPTLKSASVSKVMPNSPAEVAGLVTGDQIVEIEGRSVAGAKAKDFKPFLSKNIGETVNLKVKRSSGEVISIAISER